ncbi:MAG: transglutaminase family protein [Prevotellaceae bacterium]|nr:transglutaminase family protein [Prevotellaceae bacterium]
MKRYLYNYQTILTFSSPVINHSVLLRCQPMNADYQTVEEEHVIMSPDFWTCKGTDSFGNRILFGGEREPHSSFAFVSTGIVSMEPYNVKVTHGISPIYYLPTRLTSLSTRMERERTADIVADAMDICHAVHVMIEYVPCATTVETSAEDALQQRKGVCQDYAHLMIAICRQSGIAARYVCGFMEGTGETHAWVEIFDGYRWVGIDPTSDSQIVYGYVKLAHGRDAADCAVSRGLYAGLVSQEQIINVTLKEI